MMGKILKILNTSISEIVRKLAYKLILSLDSENDNRASRFSPYHSIDG
jgi:hypothetical protein